MEIGERWVSKVNPECIVKISKLEMSMTRNKVTYNALYNGDRCEDISWFKRNFKKFVIEPPRRT